MIDLKNTQPQTRFKILLIGDDCEDVYQYGNVDRISPEAPVPVFNYSHEERRPGMAGNVKLNLEALGCEVDYLHGDKSIKTRVVDLRSRQQIVRIDKDIISTPIQISPILTDTYDAVVISDYNKGSVNYDLITGIRKTYQGPVFLDTKKTNLDRFDDVFVKINELEYKNIQSSNNLMIVTLGNKGAMFIDSVGTETYYSCPRVEVVDVTGAGDTFLSALAFEYLRSKDISVAINFANLAASVSVQRLGCYAPKIEEIS